MVGYIKKSQCSNNFCPVGVIIGVKSQDQQYIKYSCDSCKICFNNKIEYMKHSDVH